MASSAPEPGLAAQAADPVALSAHLTDREGRAPEIRETHISWVFLIPNRAYKLKKPLVLPFLDYGSPEKRKHMCCEEVRLNRRLAPDVYLGVRSIVPHQAGVAFSGPDDPDAIDYVVEMKRYSEAGTLAARLRDGDATPEDLRRVGARLAEFHAACPAQGAGGSAAHGVESEIDRNALELLDVATEDRDRAQIRRAWRFLIARIRSLDPELADRSRRGLVREVHGDVRAEHILLGERIEIVDCLEFDRALRTLDVADELGFLVMDLIDASADHLVRPLREGYGRAGGDWGDDALVALFAVHRALVRAKVSWVTAGEHAGSAQAAVLERARRFLATAERLSWRARLPLTLIICGLPGSGKSRLAEQLSRLSGLPVLSSDLIRKELAGVAPTHPARAAHYTPEFNRRTYRELGRRTRREVEERNGALVDATFRHAEDRRAFMAEFGSRFYAVECVAPADVLRSRASTREEDPSRVSDASPEVVERLLGDWGPLDEMAPEDHLTLRSDRTTNRIVADLTALLDDRLLNSRS